MLPENLLQKIKLQSFYMSSMTKMLNAKSCLSVYELKMISEFQVLNANKSIIFKQISLLLLYTIRHL